MELVRLNHEHFFNKSVRIDGRKFNEFRDLLANVDSIKTADSSMIVKIGSTAVMCGIKVMLDENIKTLDSFGYSDFIDLKVTLHPLDDDKDAGEEDETSHLLSKLIKENELFDYKSLIAGDDDGDKQYLSLLIELICLNNDGNVFDAFLIAFLAAINSLLIPSLEDIVDEDPISLLIKSEKRKTGRRLNLLKCPIGITFAIMKDGLVLVDPNKDEEELASGTMSVVFDVKTDQIMILEKRGGCPLDESSLLKHLTFAKSLAFKFFKSASLFQPSDDAMET